MRRAKRARRARRSSAVFVHTSGWPAVVEAAMHARIADSRERTLSCTPRRSGFISRAAHQRSTRWSHEAYVGVTCGCKRGGRAHHRRINAGLCVPSLSIGVTWFTEGMTVRRAARSWAGKGCFCRAAWTGVAGVDAPAFVERSTENSINGVLSTTGVAGVDAPAFVERSTENSINGVLSTTGVAGVDAPAFVERARRPPPRSAKPGVAGVDAPAFVER